MTSTDREILISINNRLEVLTQQNPEMNARISALERQKEIRTQQQTAMTYELVNTNNKIDMLQTSIYCFFAAVAIIAARKKYHD